MTSTKLTKQQVISVLSLVIFIVVMIVLIKIFLWPAEEVSQPSLFVSPPYLTVTVPSLDNLEKVFGNSRFQELNYLEALFAPIEVEVKGRPNPFIPF